MRKLFIITLSLIMASALSFTAFAADLSVTHDKEIKAGETFEFTVKYLDENLDQVIGSIEYDDEMLEYVSGGSSEGSGGLVSIDSRSGDGKTVEETILFEAKKSGQTNIKVTTEECYDLDGNVLNSPWTEEKITIVKGGESDKKKQEAKKAELEKQKAEQERIAAEKAKAEQQKHDNDRLVVMSIVITAVLLIIVIAIVASRRKRR